MVQEQRRPIIVVVIDDDPVTLDGMTGLLESWGYTVVAAASERAALERLEARGQRPDLIVSDYRLSEGSLGTQAVEHLRKAFEIPALLFTGDLIWPPEQEMRAGHFQLMQKPANTITLRTTLKRIIQDGTV